MKLIGLKKVRNGKFLKNYELTYLNKEGREKTFEIVSRREIEDESELSAAEPIGVSIVATMGDKMLLLREFRMGVNRTIYNLCAGMIEQGETIEECIARELYEETGLQVARITRILHPSYAAVAISDITTYIAFAEVTGTFSDHTSANEQIEAGFYSKDQVSQLLETEMFSSRAQLAAYTFTLGAFPKL